MKHACVALLFLTLGAAAVASILDIRNRAEWINNPSGTNRFEKNNRYKPVLIAHAGGAINGLKYTNTIEAVTNSRANDFTYYEIDILESKDGQLFGGHDWQHFKEITNQSMTGQLTSVQVKDSVVYKKYHPVTKDFLHTFLKKNPSRFIVTDKIKNLDAVAQQLPFVDRMLVEVFSYEAYNKALSIGIKYPMLCINSERRLRRYLKKNLLKINEVEMITTPISLFRTEQTTFKKLYEKGVGIFVYTANDANFIRRHIGKSATGFYTDYVRPADITQ